MNSLKTKSITLFSVLAILVISSLIIISIFSFRHLSLEFGTSKSQAIAGVILANLFDPSIHGDAYKTSNYLTHLRIAGELDSVSLARSDSVIKQYGPGENNEYLPGPIEKDVLASGLPSFGHVDGGKDHLFSASFPIMIPLDQGHVCMECHNADHQDILGTVSFTTSLEEQHSDLRWTFGLIIGVIVIFCTGAAIFSQLAIMPLIKVANQVHGVVDKATKGNFQARIDVKRNDELGEIAECVNYLQKNLSDDLGAISNKVSHLIRYDLPPSENLLDTTCAMVECLEDVSLFKQAIEEDETTEEVYMRLAGVIRNDFFINHFTIYEVNSSKNRVLPKIVDGVETEEIQWCDPQIILRADRCRAKRTGHPVDSIKMPGICNAFIPGGDTKNSCHLCIPIIQSGSIGGVIQLVSNEVQAPLVHSLLPFLQVYLREAAPVIESKRLMSSLHNSTLTDPMTGLRNRRFLQEYTELLTTYSQRNSKPFAVLMADLDYFKQVNDTYGHEAGDTVLKQLSKILKESVRASDLVIRYGGEEFIIILRDITDPEAAMKTADKIRMNVEEAKLQLTNAVIQKTISIGVGIYPSDSENFWQVVKFADIALYKAKESGRNKVLHFEPDMWESDEPY